MSPDLTRRHFLAKAAVVAPSLAGLVACTDRTLDPSGPVDASLARLGRPDHAGRAGYGALEVYPRYPQISLPSGFHAQLLGSSGEVMSDGNVTPNAMDGMGAFHAGGNRVRLVRNHELRNGRNDPNRVTIGSSNLYDPFAPSGNTTVEVELRPDGAAQLVTSFVSLAGTYVNCAGGEAPWGSWISSEETVAGTNAGWGRNHGAPALDAPSSNPQPGPGAMSTKHVAIETSRGRIVAELFERDCPATVESFERLAAEGLFDRTAVRGLEAGRLIEADPPLGTDGPGWTVPCEVVGNRNRHGEGALTMITPEPGTGGNRFAIVLDPAGLPERDGAATVFGRVEQGLEVARALRVGDQIDRVEVWE